MSCGPDGHPIAADVGAPNAPHREPVMESASVHLRIGGILYQFCPIAPDSRAIFHNCNSDRHFDTDWIYEV